MTLWRKTAVSLSEGLLEAGIAHLLVWRQSDGSLGSRTISDSDGLGDVLPALLAGHEKELSEKEERRADLFEDINVSDMIWLCYCSPKLYFEIDAHITAICCTKKDQPQSGGDIAETIWLSPKTYQNELTDLII